MTKSTQLKVPVATRYRLNAVKGQLFILYGQKVTTGALLDSMIMRKLADDPALGQRVLEVMATMEPV